MKVFALFVLLDGSDVSGICIAKSTGAGKPLGVYFAKTPVAVAMAS
jgi:hypothetical protein